MTISGTEYAPPRVPSFNVTFRHHFSKPTIHTFRHIGALAALKRHFYGIFHVDEEGFFAPTRDPDPGYGLNVDLSNEATVQSLLNLPDTDELDSINVKHIEPGLWGVHTSCAIDTRWIYGDVVLIEPDGRLRLNAIRQEWRKRQERALVIA